MTGLKKWFQRKRYDDLIESEELESLGEEGRGMVRGIVELSDTPVKEAMIPRIDTVFVPHDTGGGEPLAKIMESGHSRFPVFRDTIDNVIGILYVKDLLSTLIKGKEVSIPDVLRSAYFVPESMKLDSLLREMKQRRIHIAVAVDEYGGVSESSPWKTSSRKSWETYRMSSITKARKSSLRPKESGSAMPGSISKISTTPSAAIFPTTISTPRRFRVRSLRKDSGRYEKTTWNGYLFVIQSLEGHKIRQVK